MKENKIEVLNDFFKKYVFVPRQIVDTPWADGACSIVKGIIQELEDASIQEVLDFVTISGDFKKIDSYKKIRDFFKEKNNSSVKFIINIEAKETELSYLETLAEYVERYKENRQLDVEEIYDFCADKGIDTMTIHFADGNLLSIKDVYLSLPADLPETEKQFKLRMELNKLNK